MYTSTKCGEEVTEVVHDGYAVCDDMIQDRWYAKQLLSCQGVLTVSSAEGRVRQVEWGLPCIWTCDEWHDPRTWSPDMEGFVVECCTVFDMFEHGWKTVYEEKPKVEDVKTK